MTASLSSLESDLGVFHYRQWRWAVLLWLLAFLACSAGSEPEGEKASQSRVRDSRSSPEAPKGRNVLLIVIDTLRADGLGCYGYNRPTSPTLNRLAREGILFERFHASAPWTTPSFASLLTGVSPSVHRAGRILSKVVKGRRKEPKYRFSRIESDVPTLPEMLGQIKTGAIVNNNFLLAEMGFSRGFDTYDHRMANVILIRNAAEVTQKACAWLNAHRKEPFFLLVHYFDPHVAYNPSTDLMNKFAPGPQGRIDVPFRGVVRARRGELNPTEEEKAFIRGLYDAEVRFTDDQIGLLVLKAWKLGLFDNTWIVVTADHGEEHFDHGSFEHGHRYEDEVLRIPLIIRPPGGKWRSGTRIKSSASLVDLLPTILEWFSIAPPDYIEGKSLMPLITGEETQGRITYAEYNLSLGQQCALFDGRYKLIWDLLEGRGYMYDLLEDPGERRRLNESHPRFKGLEKQLFEYRQRFTKSQFNHSNGDETIVMSPDVEESLRSLGYIQ